MKQKATLADHQVRHRPRTIKSDFNSVTDAVRPDLFLG